MSGYGPANLAARLRALRAQARALAKLRRPQGRPRKRAAYRATRLAKAEAAGTDLQTLREVTVTCNRAEGPARAERIRLAVSPDPRWGWRVWLLCPQCGLRRAHLYPTTYGIMCRGCGELGYGRPGAGAAQASDTAGSEPR